MVGCLRLRRGAFGNGEIGLVLTVSAQDPCILMECGKVEDVCRGIEKCSCLNMFEFRNCAIERGTRPNNSGSRFQKILP